MISPFRLSGRRAVLTAVAVLALLALPGARRALEASMTLHMLVQFPLLAFAGFLLAAAFPGRWLARMPACNAYGISGLFLVAVALAILMIPRALDLALVDVRIEFAKWLALLSCGAALRLSWRPAGLLVQGFFLGNVLPMMVVVGSLYESSPVRVCNAYLLDDQVRLGRLVVWVSAGIALVWFAHLTRVLLHRESVAVLPEPLEASAAATKSAAPESR
jgi:hypothetical protein